MSSISIESFFNITPWISFIFILISLISLFFKKPLELVLMGDIQKVILHFSRIVGITFILLAIFSIYMDYSSNNTEKLSHNEVLYIIKLVTIMSVIISFGLYIMSYPIITAFTTKKMYILKKDVVDYNEDFKYNFDKLYIIKSINKNKVLLSNHNELYYNSIQIIETEEFLSGKLIHTEHRSIRESFRVLIEEIKKMKNKKIQ